MRPQALSSRVALVALALLVLPVARASAADVAAALAAERRDLVLDAGELAGPGGVVLREAAADSRFVLLGEDHGIAEVPALATALFRLLEPAGFDTLAVEVGPRVASEVERILGMDERRGRFEAFLSEYPVALAFYDLEEEFAFLSPRLVAPKMMELYQEASYWDSETGGRGYDEYLEVRGTWIRTFQRRLREIAPHCP